MFRILRFSLATMVHLWLLVMQPHQSLLCGAIFISIMFFKCFYSLECPGLTTPLLRRVAGLSLRDRVRSLVIREELGVDPLLLRVERSQMSWLGHLVRMPQGRLPGEVFRARPIGPGKTQDTLERLCLSAGLGTPRDPPGRAGRSGWGEGSLDFPA